jgi:flagellar motility protein MotE (MotC chaperone)
LKEELGDANERVESLEKTIGEKNTKIEEVRKAMASDAENARMMEQVEGYLRGQIEQLQEG